MSEWIYYSVDKKNRNILALHGYRHVPALKVGPVLNRFKGRVDHRKVGLNPRRGGGGLL